MKLLQPIIIPFICLFCFHPVFSQDNWVLRKEKNSIRVFSRKTKNSRLVELKVESVFEGKASQLAAVLVNVDKHSEWVYRTVKSQLIKQINRTDLYYYSEIESPWPFSNRDMVVHLKLQQAPLDKTITVTVKSETDILPLKKNIVRIKYSLATWVITAISNQQFKVVYTIQIDPGDGVPLWIINLFAINGPYESFMRLKEKIKLPEYQQSTLIF